MLWPLFIAIFRVHQNILKDTHSKKSKMVYMYVIKHNFILVDMFYYAKA